MSLYPLNDPKIMEAVRQLTVEEMLCVLHDVAQALVMDRMRDKVNEEHTIRPGYPSLEAVVHALKSAGMEVPGEQTRDDLEQVFGDDVDEIIETKDAVLERMKEVGAEIESSMNTDSILRAMSRDRHPSTPPPIPDDLEGFGWGA